MMHPNRYGDCYNNLPSLNIKIVAMDNDLVLFLAGVSCLILYLVFSALTEMGTKLPWKK